MRVIDLALKDLLQILRDKKSLIFILVMPIAFTFFFGALYAAPSGGDARLPLGLIDEDEGGLLSAGLRGQLDQSDIVRLESLTVSVEAATDRVRRETLAGVLVIPAGFSEQTLAGSSPQVTLIRDENTQSGHMARRAVETNLIRVLGAVQTAQLSVEAAEAQAPWSDAAARRTYLEAGVRAALEAWRTPPLTVEVEKGTAAAPKQAAMGYAQSSPGMMVQFAIYGLLTAGTVLVAERRSRTLQRLLTTPIRRVEIIAGKVLGMFVLVFVQQLILLAVGQFVLKIDYLREPLAILVVVAALSLWATSLGLLIGAISRGEEQVIVWTLVAMFLFSALGGAWFSLEVTGKTFSLIGHLLPSAWAMEGLQNIVVRGLGFSSVLFPTLIILAYAVLFFGLAVWRLKFE